MPRGIYKLKVMLVAVESSWLDFKLENVRWCTTALMHDKCVAEYLRVISFIV